MPSDLDSSDAEVSVAGVECQSNGNIYQELNMAVRTF